MFKIIGHTKTLMGCLYKQAKGKIYSEQQVLIKILLSVLINTDKAFIKFQVKEVLARNRLDKGISSNHEYLQVIHSTWNFQVYKEKKCRKEEDWMNKWNTIQPPIPTLVLSPLFSNCWLLNWPSWIRRERRNFCKQSFQLNVLFLSTVIL